MEGRRPSTRIVPAGLEALADWTVHVEFRDFLNEVELSTAASACESHLQEAAAKGRIVFEDVERSGTNGKKGE